MEEKHSIQNNVAQFGELSIPLQQRLQSMPIKTFKKGTILLSEGNVCDRGFHIISGTLRVFYILNGKEITSRFCEAGEACISYYSFYRQEPSFEFIDCIEDCTISVVSFIDIQKIYHDFPEFNRIMRIGMETSHAKSEERSRIIRSLTARERYLAMKKKRPAVFNIATTEQIATFIGLTRESLCRIMCKERQTEKETEEENEMLLNAFTVAGIPC